MSSVHAAARPAAVSRGQPLAGITLLIASLWTLSCLDAGGKWVMAAGVPLLVLAWVRYVVHFAIVLACLLPVHGMAVLHSVSPRRQLLRGGFMLGATLALFSTLRYLPQAEATAINFLAPLIVLASAPWLLKEPPRMSRWIAAGVAFIGVLIIIRPGGGLNPVGTAFGLLSACFFAGQYITTRGVARDNPLTSIIWSGAVGALGLTLLAPFLIADAVGPLQALDTAHWLALLSTGVTGALGHLLQIRAYRLAPASILAPFTYMQIVSATTTGWLIWGHFPDALTWLGIAIICVSGIAIGLREWRVAEAARRRAAPD